MKGLAECQKTVLCRAYEAAPAEVMVLGPGKSAVAPLAGLALIECRTIERTTWVKITDEGRLWREASPEFVLQPRDYGVLVDGVGLWIYPDEPGRRYFVLSDGRVVMTTEDGSVSLVEFDQGDLKAMNKVVGREVRTSRT